MATVVSASSKVKRLPPGIQTNGITASTSSPSPSLSTGRLPSGTKYPPNSATSNGGATSAGSRSANRVRREASGQLLGRGQRNSSVGLRSASVADDTVASPIIEPLPYSMFYQISYASAADGHLVKTDAYILRKFRDSPPSLIIHLHPTHFRFDQQEGSFSYKSPMRVLLEHLRKRTIPHELIDFFMSNGVPFYEDCMIVQIHDHKSAAPSQNSSRVSALSEKSVPFSIHNYHASVTPSPYMPYPEENSAIKKNTSPDPPKADDEKTSAEKDKENMPAPAIPSEGQKMSAQKRNNISTIVLHPTSLSNYIELASKAITPRTNATDGRNDHKQDVTALLPSSLGPATPAVPSTPGINMGPPAKKAKKARMEIDSSTIHQAEALIALTRNAPLILDPVRNSRESAALLRTLEHPMHCDKPPQPKTRKRTIAEMAADEALAAEQEQFMLIMDERLSASKGGAQGGGKAGDGDGQAGGAPFEPRFERFKTLENIRNQHEENRRIERSRQMEAERVNAEKMKREQLRAAAEEERRMQQERQRSQQAQQQAQHQLQQAREQEQQRRALMARQSGMQGLPAQVQGQHGHPQAGAMQNGMMPNGIQGQTQRFHHQQASQGPLSSPIIRHGTPHSNPSPTVANIAGVPLQHSTSSMGGSPPRPGSVVNQGPSQMPTSHAMNAQRSQQSHAADTPRMPNATPNIQSTPLARQVSATPRMSAASPPQPQMAQTPNMAMNQQVMMNTPMHMTPQQQQQLQHQLMQRRLQQAQAMGGMINGQQISQQQLAQQQMRAMQAGVPPNQQLAQGYAAQLAAMQRPGGAGPQINSNVAGNGAVMNIQHLQQIQQMQMQQQQMQQHAQNQQMPQLNQQQHAQMLQRQFQMRVQKVAQAHLQQHLPQINLQYHGNIPPEVLDNLKRQCQERATAQVQSDLRQRQLAAQQQQQQQQLQQQMMMQQGGMPQNMNSIGRQI